MSTVSSSDSEHRTLMKTSEVTRRYGVSAVTLMAWAARPDVGFPSPVTVSRRNFWRKSELDAWDASGPAASSDGGKQAA